MTTMLIVLGLIVLVFAVGGFLVGYADDSNFGDGILAAAVGVFFGSCTALCVGCFWVALHFLSKVW